MKKDASRFSPKGVLFHRTFFTAPHFDYQVCEAVPIVWEYIFRIGLTVCFYKDVKAVF